MTLKSIITNLFKKSIQPLLKKKEAPATQTSTLNLDPADLVMLTMHHKDVNEVTSISDIDTLIELAIKFKKKYSKTNWEKSKIDWESAIVFFYNTHINSLYTSTQ